MDLTVIIPTYNRRTFIAESIDSALLFIQQTKRRGEIIIVDDGSTDGTDELISRTYAGALASGCIRFIRFSKNMGVNTARNHAAEAARAPWLLLLDSDDRFIPATAGKVMAVLDKNIHCPLVFFRCRELETKRLVGPDQKTAYRLNLRQFLNQWTPGECLTVIRRQCLLMVGFDAGMQGAEGLTYARMIQAFGPALVNETVTREYRQTNSDRLCTKANLKKRANTLLRYHRTILAEFLPKLSPLTIGKTIIKILYYRVLSPVRRLNH